MTGDFIKREGTSWNTSQGDATLAGISKSFGTRLQEPAILALFVHNLDYPAAALNYVRTIGAFATDIHAVGFDHGG
jgi:hypothetical protein